uniref:Otogelin like n=1 Tax=Paramormyrops kingsleyae TaxID=1676925 RepID=A0A3B3RLC4_9TELE
CSCLNGGWCKEGGLCDCAQFQASGERCQIANTGQDRDGICRSWGQHHFETFDGIYYYFPGKCSYILAKDCHRTEPQYTVWVHNERDCEGPMYTCARSLSLYFPNEEEILIAEYQVHKGGVRLSLPQTIHNVFIERLADYILVKSTFGLSLAWDGGSGVYIKMTEEHKGRPCGLCGNYNDDGSDDLEDTADFGNSWHVDLPHQAPCEPVEDDFSGPCKSESDMELVHRSDDEETFCRTLVEYTRACSHVGYPVREWRDSFPTCDRCEDSFVHRDCISCCPPTCTFEKECLGTNLHCLDGCYCPDMILQNGTCIAVSQCPCVYHGHAFPQGHVLEQGCSSVCMGGVWNCTEGNECSIMGNSHITSFDGRIFTHLGTCQYVLVKSRGSTRFMVTLQNVPCGEQVTLTREGEVFIGTVEVRQLTSLFVQLHTVFGLHVQFDGRGGRLYVLLDSSWKGFTVGLCGTFNGNLRDDFSPSGMIEGTPQLHANAWKVSSACSNPVNVPIIDPCDLNQENFYASLCVVLTEELFAPCHEYVSPSVYYQQCRFQACLCGGSCMCTALAHYAYVCAKHQVVINFRAHVSECVVCLGGMMYHSCTSTCGRTCQSLSSGELCSNDCAEGCGCSENTFYDDVRQRCCHCYFMGSVFQPGEPEPRDCPPGKVYYSCREPQTAQSRLGLACEVTCRNLMINLTCSPMTPCVPGCGCPALVRHNGECYYPENCPCAWLGLEYLPGEVVSTPCSKTCHRGFFNCTYYPCPGVCTAYSDRHYHTFDGLEYDYVSNCQVYLSINDTEISITTQNKDCYDSGIICMKYLVIYVGLTKIYFSDSSGKPSSTVVGKGYEFHLWRAGYYTVVHFPKQEITILWDKKTTVHIRAGPQWKGQLTGMCGNFDTVTVNDMTTSSHMEVSNPQSFGDSWALGQCESDFVVKRPCEGDLNRQPYAKRECAVLYSDVFAPCHNVVDVTWFYKNCLTDTCNCNRGGDCECLCTSIAAYAHKCCQQGVTVHWRSPTVCAYDCEYYNQLGEGPYVLSNAAFNDTVIGANLTSGEVFSLPKPSAQGGVLFNFMVTVGLYKDKLSVPMVSLESAERPNYFLCVTGRLSLRLERWSGTEDFRQRGTFVHHQGLWLPSLSSFELYGQKGIFLTLSPSGIRAMAYDHSEHFRQISSFMLESSFVIPYRIMCEWKYHACSSPCLKTCSDPTASQCRFLPVEGCFPRCPKNMILDEVTRRCVYREDCEYPPYSYRVDECSEYICFNGQLMFHNASLHCRFNVSQPNCGLLGMAVQTNRDNCCPQWECPRCSVISDLRVITFDGNNVALYDNGSYILVHLPRENIVGHIEKCPTVSVNFINARLPFTRQKLHIDDTGTMYVIHTPGGVSIQWYHSTGIIVLQYSGRPNITTGTRGLCCDGNPADDLKLPNGTVVRDVEDIPVFLHSWMVDTSEEMGYFRRVGDNCTTGNCTKCFQMLNRRPFSECHRKVSPEQFCDKIWAGDLHYKDHECDFLAAYVAICYTHNICISWRTHDFCLKCPPGKEYHPCVNTCKTKTCQNRDFYEESTCSSIREECVCKSGTILHRADSAFCVTEDRCCTDNDGVPRAVGEVWNGSNKGCCLYRCMENGSITAVEPDCSDMPAPLCEREGEFVVDVVEEGACCPKKICCNLTICESEVPTCENGNKLMIGYSTLSCCPEYRCCDPQACPSVLMPECRDDQFLVEVRAEKSCCFSFLSVCESCIDPIPLCKDGEILAVDLNTTDRCCPQYHCGKAEVCLFQGVTVLSPGQSMVQYFDGDLCYTVHCLQDKDPDTGFYAMDVSTVNCSEKCGPHQIYIPSSDPHVCCGSCKNVSCIYTSENSTMEAGSSWVTNCTRFDCVETAVGAVTLGSVVVCPPFNDTECVQNGGTVQNYIDGCCKTCLQITVYSCDGKCPSATIFNFNINSHARFCKCCRENTLQSRTVQLYCTRNSTLVSYTFQEPLECSCQWN